MLSQDNGRFCVFEDRCQAFAGIAWVKRNVRRSRLEHAQDGGQQVRIPLEEHAHKNIRPGAQLNQVMRNFVCALIQLTIAGALVPATNGRGIGRTGAGDFDQRLHHPGDAGEALLLVLPVAQIDELLVRAKL